jgi:ribosomal protein S18 acetylase RimI-like enzyme
MNIISGSLEIHPSGAEPGDLEQLLRVYRQCEDFLALGPVSSASLEMVRADLDLSAGMGGLFCGIFDRESGELLGVVDFVLCGWEGDPHAGYLSLLMIALPHRRKGIGEQVVSAVEEVMRREGNVKAVHAGVQVNNPDAIRFWQCMGYRIVSEPIQYPDQTCAFNLYKPLAAETDQKSQDQRR